MEWTSPLQTASTSAHRAPKYYDCWLRERKKKFQRLSRPQGTCFCRKEPRKKSQMTPPEIDTGTVRLVAQRLNHYATPGPICTVYIRWTSNFKISLHNVTYRGHVTVKCDACNTRYSWWPINATGRNDKQIGRNHLHWCCYNKNGLAEGDWLINKA